MTRTKNSFVKKVILVLTAAFVLTESANAQNQNTVCSGFKPNAVKSLIAGISSGNEGLKRDCIYFAAKYNVKETVDALTAQMKAEKNPRNRVLIAFALYQLGVDDGIKAVYNTALKDDDVQVRRMCAALYNEYKNSNRSVVISK